MTGAATAPPSKPVWASSDIDPPKRGRPRKVTDATTATPAPRQRGRPRIHAAPSTPKRPYARIPRSTPRHEPAYDPPDQTDHWPAQEFGERVVEARPAS